MTLIDQRILIDAPPQIVWDYIADPAKITRWHAAYRSISVLTTQQTGLGTRRRCTMADGSKDTIEQITAWVEGLGYEYTLIEGGRYRSFRGRLRLTAGPDGTTVQWTVTYRPRGPLGALRSLLGGRREMQAMMADSLRRLRRQIDELGLRMDADYRQRVSMRGRLNHSERLEYQRRHAPPLEAVPEGEGGAAEGMPAAPVPPVPVGEPPLVAPLPAEIVPPPHIVPPASVPPTPVPAFVSDLLSADTAPADLPGEADTEPRPPAGLREVLAVFEVPPPLGPVPPAPQIAPPPIAPSPEVDEALYRAPTRPLTSREPDAASALPVVPGPAPEYALPTPPRGIPAVRAGDDPAAAAAREAERSAEPPAPFARSAEPAAPTPPRGIPSVRAALLADERPPERAHLPPPTPPTDTGELSIWEIFGIKRPSERDAEALNELISSVSSGSAEKRAQAPGQRLRWARRPLALRRAQMVVGLRGRLARQRLRVRTFRRD